MLEESMSPRFRRPHPASSADPIRVLLCDDVPAFRSLIRCSLEDEEGIVVVGEAGDGNEGIQLVSDLRPDVVLLDLAMPDCDGLEAIPAMRAGCPAVAIVALSGFTAERLSGPAKSLGANAYLEKGVDLSQIVSTIREVCHPTPA
jgi:DNA-binding NarL/FixJ family response regulator